MGYRIYTNHNDLVHFITGDLAEVALDTETMGQSWRELHALRNEPMTPAERKKFDKAIKDDRSGLSVSENILAVVQFCRRDGDALLFFLNGRHAIENCKLLFRYLLDLKPVWLLHNAKFDLTQIEHHLGISFVGQEIHDTMICETLIHGNKDYKTSMALKSVSAKYAESTEDTKADSTGTQLSDWWAGMPSDEQLEYAYRDTAILFNIYDKQVVALKNMTAVKKIENTLIVPLREVEKTGFKFDTEKLHLFIEKARVESAKYEAVFRNVFGDVNPNSPKQMIEAVEKVYQVIPKVEKWDKTTKKFEAVNSTDKFALLKYGLLEHEDLRAMLRHKELEKMITEAETWLGYNGNRLYTEYVQLARKDDGKTGGTRTGRLSSTPNMQNQSNLMKQFIVAPEGYTIIGADYAAIELRMMASLADDTAFKAMFRQGRNPHLEMAAKAFRTPMDAITKKSNLYKSGKIANFLFIYKGSGRRFVDSVLAATDGKLRLTVDEGNAFQDAFFEEHPDIKNYLANNFARACEVGYVSTRSGRRRYYNWGDRPADLEPMGKVFWPAQRRFVSSRYAPDWKWEKVCANTPDQGTCADACKLAIIRLINRINPSFNVLATTHDSIDILSISDKIQENAILLQDAMVTAMATFMKDVEPVVELTAGHCWASKPEHDEDGLVFQTDFQEPLLMG